MSSLLARVAQRVRAFRRPARPAPVPPRSSLLARPLTADERRICVSWFERLLRDTTPGQPITLPRSAVARLIATLRQ